MTHERIYNQAIEHLRSKELEERLGAIRALEGIARESERYHWPIIEVLTAYVRQHAGRFREVRPQEEEASNEEQAFDDGTFLVPDIEAIMMVLQRRTRYYGYGEPEPLDLQATELHGANLQGTNLQGADLRGAGLIGTRLQGADLSKANLSVYDHHGLPYKVELFGADLRGATLVGANLQRADLSNANISQANLSGANLRRARFVSWGHQNLSGANFSGADLRGASFVDLGAYLSGVDLRGANLQDTNLSTEDLEQAVGDENTKLPDGVERPASWNLDSTGSSGVGERRSQQGAGKAYKKTGSIRA